MVENMQRKYQFVHRNKSVYEHFRVECGTFRDFDLFSITICKKKKKMIKDYLFAEISTKCFQSTIYQCS